MFCSDQFHSSLQLPHPVSLRHPHPPTGDRRHIQSSRGEGWEVEEVQGTSAAENCCQVDKNIKQKVSTTVALKVTNYAWVFWTQSKYILYLCMFLLKHWNLGVKFQKLKNPISTCWNSAFTNMSSVLHLKAPLQSPLEDNNINTWPPRRSVCLSGSLLVAPWLS